MRTAWGGGGLCSLEGAGTVAAWVLELPPFLYLSIFKCLPRFALGRRGL